MRWDFEEVGMMRNVVWVRGNGNERKKLLGKGNREIDWRCEGF